jgi:hypothetical protein
LKQNNTTEKKQFGVDLDLKYVQKLNSEQLDSLSALKEAAMKKE